MDTDPFTEFLLGCSPVVVECERLGDYATARRESFGHASHREMLAFHQIQRARFYRLRSVNRAFLYRQSINDPRRTAA